MLNVQLFVPFISLGYILYGGSLLIRMCMIVVFYRFDKVRLSAFTVYARKMGLLSDKSLNKIERMTTTTFPI